MRAKGIYTMLSMDTYMRGMGGYHFGCIATCMAAYSAKAVGEYYVRNMLFINGFTPPLLAYTKAAKSRINHALSSIKKDETYVVYNSVCRAYCA